MNPALEQKLLAHANSTRVTHTEVIQTLWSGYGTITRYGFDNSSSKSLIVKHIAAKSLGKHPRGWDSERSHQRKLKSYEVETHWYKEWSQLCTSDCRIPRFIDSFQDGRDQFIVMEDLNEHFPLRKTVLTLTEVKRCLKWLAYFHMRFMGQKPENLWKIGTYWHLATRPDEFENIEHSELKSKAHILDELLNSCTHKTIVHGDAKIANFCFSEDGKQVAAVDFQYVGGGCGMKDVVYFIGSCLSSEECSLFEDELLNSYFSDLKQAYTASSHSFDFSALEAEWRTLYPIAWTDFTRFLLGWMPSHQKVNSYSLNVMNSVLTQL